MLSVTHTPPAVSITPIQPQNLQPVWPFVQRGAEDILRKLGPDKCDWQIFDLYASIRNGGATLHLVTRGARTLGWFVTYVQTRPFSGKKESFLWAAWSIPLRERLPDDNVPEAVALSMDYMKAQGRSLGCDSLVHLSSRRGFERWGFEPQLTAWRLWL